MKRIKKTDIPKKMQEPESRSFSINRRIIAIIIAVVIAGGFFFTGKYIEFNSPGAFDSGGYVYSAEHVLRGAKLGVDEKPGARMGTLLVNMLGVAVFGFNETGPKLIQMLLQAAALVFMFVTLRKLYGNLAACFGVIIASMYLSSPLIAKYGNVKEQHMIAVMILGICCYAHRQNGGGWWWSLLAGAILVWAPTFKPTGISAVGAVGIFTIAQPFLKNRTIRQTFVDIGLLFAGAAVSIAPLYIWLIGWHDAFRLPYKWLWNMLPIHQNNKIGGSYIAGARQLSDFSTQFARVMRYYLLLILPISLALISISIRIIRWTGSFTLRRKAETKGYEKFVLLFAIWWLLDMGFVWISPRSYEQYYLPLNASAAMLCGYVFALYSNALHNAKNKNKWVIGGIIGVLIMVFMSWHIVFGIETSPHSGRDYGQTRKGYAQKLQQIHQKKTRGLKAGWEQAAEYIRENSAEDDTIFVWGWYPGIYVYAQRISPTIKSSTSEMHVKPPQELETYIKELAADLKNQPPKFIVDTHKSHYPWDRPPLELWPTTRDGLLPNNPQAIRQYNQQYTQLLKEQVSEAEAKRYQIMAELRNFVMANYEPVRKFGNHIVFKLKNADSN